MVQLTFKKVNSSFFYSNKWKAEYDPNILGKYKLN